MVFEFDVVGAAGLPRHLARGEYDSYEHLAPAPGRLGVLGGDEIQGEEEGQETEEDPDVSMSWPASKPEDA